ncbi:MAG: redox-regulated ATPase YchF [Rhodospirillales bacterium]|nr:redox-regulated ATPase YchF [Rhodospirillales bacterium]MSP79940.1 redox-regulated ATPase YchF [Rhodospirillales bacterium]
MGFNCGIVGLPNVGKSTLFNALTATQAAEAANFPFCTITPNVGRVSVPDERLQKIADLARPEKIIPTQFEFVDIAGLVRGASRGEGLGNKFLTNIREVDAIVHVLRCFEDANVVHIEGGIDPVRDAETVETELMLADLESLEKRVPALTKRVRGGDKDAKLELDMVERATQALAAGNHARSLAVADPERRAFRMLQLLTAKPVLYVCNVEEANAAQGNKHSARAEAWARANGAEAVTISAQIESEVAGLADPKDRAAFLTDLGLAETGLARVIRAGHRLLGLIAFFTAGPKEVRAWTVARGATAAEAAGAIHTDFARGFIAAETIAYADFISRGGEQGAKEAGKMRQEGRDYAVQDGDVILFRFNV